MRRTGPRPLGHALAEVSSHLAPATTLAGVQACWADAVGPAIAEEAEPVSEREGVVTVACRSAVWAQELDLLATDLVARLNELLGGPARADRVRSLRVVVGGVRKPFP
jgi:predicted nucleic acid-binding Zn ribbon protein